MYIENLYIEPTRRCLLACEHCLRGDAQNIDMSRATLKNILIVSKN